MGFGGIPPNPRGTAFKVDGTAHGPPPGHRSHPERSTRPRHLRACPGDVEEGGIRGGGQDPPPFPPMAKGPHPGERGLGHEEPADISHERAEALAPVAAAVTSGLWGSKAVREPSTDAGRLGPHRGHRGRVCRDTALEGSGKGVASSSPPARLSPDSHGAAGDSARPEATDVSGSSLSASLSSGVCRSLGADLPQRAHGV